MAHINPSQSAIEAAALAVYGEGEYGIGTFHRGQQYITHLYKGDSPVQSAPGNTPEEAARALVKQFEAANQMQRQARQQQIEADIAAYAATKRQAFEQAEAERQQAIDAAQQALAQ
jgi:hypothetical protein